MDVLYFQDNSIMIDQIMKEENFVISVIELDEVNIGLNVCGKFSCVL